MLNTLLIALLSGALAFVALPASALELPDYGSKNFSPSGDTPTYFTNETAPIAARTADTSANDWSATDAVAPVSSAEIASAPPRNHAGRHGQRAAAQRSGKHGLGRPRGAGRLAYAGKASTGRTVTATAARSLSKKPMWVASTRGPARTGPTSAAKTTAAKHGKPGARHARAAVGYPVAMPSATVLFET